MSYIEIFLLAFALSIDACVVSFSYGLVYEKERYKNSFMLAFVTGFFQFLMPIVAYHLTFFVKSYINPYSGLIVFLIFTFLGIKFIKEAFVGRPNLSDCIDFKCLILLGIATSIDAFSAGISLSLFGNRILKPALLIGLVTFINSLVGFWIGGKLRNIPTRALEITAGLLLISLGVKALL